MVHVKVNDTGQSQWHNKVNSTIKVNEYSQSQQLWRHGCVMDDVIKIPALTCGACSAWYERAELQHARRGASRAWLDLAEFHSVHDSAWLVWCGRFRRLWVKHLLIYRRICLIFESEVRSDDLTIAMVFVVERKLLAAKIQRIPLTVAELSREGIKKKVYWMEKLR